MKSKSTQKIQEGEKNKKIEMNSTHLTTALFRNQPQPSLIQPQIAILERPTRSPEIPKTLIISIHARIQENPPNS